MHKDQPHPVKFEYGVRKGSRRIPQKKWTKMGQNATWGSGVQLKIPPPLLATTFFGHGHSKHF